MQTSQLAERGSCRDRLLAPPAGASGSPALLPAEATTVFLVVLLVVLLAEADLLASLVLRLAAEAGADANPAMKQRATSAANRRFIGCLR
jgi:hypothetical protein